MINTSNNIKNGIILCGGTGSRLLPFTEITNKSLLNIKDKFIIDYPLETLKEIGVENLTVVLGDRHFEQIVKYLKDGSNFGFNINYVYQAKPMGIAQAINLCSFTLKNVDKFAVILGDNIFQDPVFWKESDGCQICLNKHAELQRFGVASVQDNKIVKLEEKPQFLDSQFENYAVSGLYQFDNKFFDFFKKLKLSNRNEYEIIEIIEMYRRDNKLKHCYYEGFWHDAGTHEALQKVIKNLL